MSRVDATAVALTAVALRPIGEGDAPELHRIHATPEVSRWWGAPEEGFPWEDAESTRLVIELEGRVVGMIQFAEELDPKYRHASIDLFLDPAVHGRGVGPEAVRSVVRHLIHERGHHRVTIDPAAANTAAIRAYEKVGFRPVGVMRQYERDADGGGWHDGLLMELLRDERRAMSSASSADLNEGVQNDALEASGAKGESHGAAGRSLRDPRQGR